MLTCVQVTELVTDFAEGRLTLLDRIRFHLHIGMCWACRRYLRQMRRTVRILGALPVEPPPPAVRDELVRRLRRFRRPA